MHGDQRKNCNDSFPQQPIVNSIDTFVQNKRSGGKTKVVLFIGTHNYKLARFDCVGDNYVNRNNDSGLNCNQMVSSSGMCKINNICGEDDGVIYDNNGNITLIKEKRHTEVRIDESKQILLRSKSKKEPLPMKLRALPQSFWQQPNNTPSQSPGTVCSTVPLLCKEEDTGCITTDVKTSPRTEEVSIESHEEIVSDANTDLLFSLFHVVEEEQRRSEGQPKVTVIRRGRLKKLRNGKNRGVLKDDDPYLINTVTESLLPLLPERPIRDITHKPVAVGHQDSAMNSEQPAPTTTVNSNTAGTSDQNYSHILSEVVIRL